MLKETKNEVLRIFCFLLPVILFGTAIFGYNPLIYQKYTADPTACWFNNRMYIYCSHDQTGATGYNISDVTLISSDDLVNWTDEGEPVKAPANASWAGLTYAPACAYRNGYYYVYFGNGGGSIGVVRGTSPSGPFTDPLGHAMITGSTPGCSGMTYIFDPAALIDDDGQAYLYFGGGGVGNARVIKLNSDMISVNGSAVTINAPRFFEDSMITKYNGTYYYSYSTDFSASPAASIDYMTSSNPMTGFTHRGTVLFNPPNNCGNNNHHSIVNIGSNYYISYHDRSLSNSKLGNCNGIYQRSVCLDRLYFNSDGTIAVVTPTTAGVSALKNQTPYTTMKSVTMAKESGIQTETCSEGGLDVTNIQNGYWIQVRNLDFGSGASAFNARVASAGSGGNIQIRLDSTTGTIVGTCAVTGSGGAQTWKTVSCAVTGATGLHDVFFVFTGGSGTLFNFEWYSFTQANVTVTATPPVPTNTFTKTNTPIPPTNTFTKTNTPVPPTNTFTKTYTPTNTFTKTNTLVPPTNTFTNTYTPTNTFTKTNTPIPPTATPTTPAPTNTSTSSVQPTNTSTPIVPTATPTPTNTSTSLLQPTNTSTLIVPTATPTTPAPTNTSTSSVQPTNTSTLIVPTATPTTPVPTNTSTNSVQPTNTSTPIVPTATPTTPVPTNTQVPTFTPTITPGSGALTVYLLSSVTTNSTNSPHPQIEVKNTGTGALNLNNVEVRYWINCDCTGQSVQAWVDWAGLLPAGTSVTGNIQTAFVPTSLGGQTNYISYRFTGNMVLQPGQMIQIQSRFNLSDWSNMLQSNDWSFAAYTAFTAWSKITGYISGGLVWGSEPSSTSSQTAQVNNVMTYPNPATSSSGATLKYSVSSSSVGSASMGTSDAVSIPVSGKVRISIYTVSERLIWQKTLDDPSFISIGEHAVHWDGKTAGGQNLAAGTYILKVSLLSNSGASNGYSTIIMLK